ncbi:MAG: hypothetical protein HC835_15625 [Oscillatoriales cyanobacterium RM2_1_1]|nr:hypothetical protein [Oscillatoriales cyanobacterium SM2_3_0]NJO46929.1 hypothetical protein [Oscillatoriales cyanobacterium RM2_1_1]
MAHTFLVRPGQWMLEGQWLERQNLPVPVRGKTMIAWDQNDWFRMATKLVFPGHEYTDIVLQYRGRFDQTNRQYSFILQHSEFGNVEGEGLIGPESIVQRYWVLGSEQQRRSGLETLRQIKDDRYYYSSVNMSGISMSLTSVMEAVIERKP